MFDKVIEDGWIDEFHLCFFHRSCSAGVCHGGARYWKGNISNSNRTRKMLVILFVVYLSVCVFFQEFN